MSRRASAALVAALVGGLLAGCDSDTRDEIRESLPSRTASPTADAPTPEPTDEPTEEPTEEPTPEPTDEPTSEPTAEPTQEPEPAPTVTVTETAVQPPPGEEAPVDDQATADTDGADEEISWYGWALLALAVLGVVVWLVRRGRNDGTNIVAAEAIGQISWVRTTVDDQLLEWRGRQLAAPASARDTGSDNAARWSQVEGRLRRATDELLTYETAEGDSQAALAARKVRQSLEQYRASVQGVAASLATGDEQRIAQARAALTADTATLDRDVTTLRVIAKLPEPSPS